MLSGRRKWANLVGFDRFLTSVYQNPSYYVFAPWNYNWQWLRLIWCSPPHLPTIGLSQCQATGQGLNCLHDVAWLFGHRPFANVTAFQLPGMSCIYLSTSWRRHLIGWKLNKGMYYNTSQFENWILVRKSQNLIGWLPIYMADVIN